MDHFLVFIKCEKYCNSKMTPFNFSYLVINKSVLNITLIAFIYDPFISTAIVYTNALFPFKKDENKDFHYRQDLVKVLSDLFSIQELLKSKDA